MFPRRRALKLGRKQRSRKLTQLRTQRKKREYLVAAELAKADATQDNNVATQVDDALKAWREAREAEAYEIPPATFDPTDFAARASATVFLS